MVGLFEGVKKAFGKKEMKNVEEEATIRLAKPEEKVREEDEPGKLYLRAKKWREEQAMQEPLVKREAYKKKW